MDAEYEKTDRKTDFPHGKLVFLSRMDEEGTKLEKVSFSLSDAVLDTAEGFRSVAKTKGKQFEINVAEHVEYVGDEKISGR